jgi:hypothetical protein
MYERKTKTIGPRISPAHWRMVNDQGLERCEYSNFEPRLVTDMLHELRILAEEERERGRPVMDTSVRALLDEVEAVVAGTPRGFDLWASETFRNTDMKFWKEHHGKISPPARHRLVVECMFPTRGNLSVRVSPGTLSKIGTWTEAPEWSIRASKFAPTGRIGARPDVEVLYLRNLAPLFSPHRSEGSPYERRVRHVVCKAVCTTFWLVMHRLDGVFDVHLDGYVAALSSLDGPDPSIESSKMELIGLEVVDVVSDYRRNLADRLQSFALETGLSAIDFWRIAETADSWETASKLLRQRRQGGSADLVPTLVRDYHHFLKRTMDYGVWKEPQHLDPDGMPKSMFEDENGGEDD